MLTQLARLLLSNLLLSNLRLRIEGVSGTMRVLAGLCLRAQLPIIRLLWLMVLWCVKGRDLCSHDCSPRYFWR